MRDIISLVDHHTLLVELLAHLTKATHANPGQTLEKLRDSRITGLPNETVRLRKDGKESSDSVHEHIKKIFSMESISDGCTLILAMLAFMPVEGIKASKFKSFYSIKNCDNLNWLIHHGWVSSIYENNDEIFRIHPAVASVIIEHLKTKETLRDTFFARSCDAITACHSEEISEAEQILLADSLALSATSRYPIKCRNAAIFIEQYVEQYSRYGNAESKLNQIDFAIRSLEINRDERKYSAVLENGYYLQANILYTLQQYERAIAICEEHLVRAKQVNDIYFAARWCLLLQGMYSDAHLGDQTKWSRYNRLSVFYIKKNLRRSSRFLNNENLIERLDYDYLEKEKDRFPDHLEILNADLLEGILDTNIFFLKHSRVLTRLEMLQLNGAKKIREIIRKRGQLHNIDNNFQIEIDKAKVAFLANQHQKAEGLLQELVKFINEKSLSSTPTIYYIHQLLAQIALWKEESKYETAISEFECCMKIGEDLLLHNTYTEQLELGYLYIVCGDIEKAIAINAKLLHETYSLASSIRKTYYADALRNIGYLYYAQGNLSTATNMLQEAVAEYNKAVAPDALISFGKARTYKHLADLCALNLDFNGTTLELPIYRITFLEYARDYYERCVGLNYPEAKGCLKRLEELRGQQQQ